MSLASDELSDRIRSLLPPGLVLREQKMFGAVAFMLDGNMLVAPMKSGALLVRTGKEAQAEALARPGAAIMSMTGRTMSGYVEVSGDAIEDDDVLSQWLDIALAFVRTLPPKSKGDKEKA